MISETIEVVAQRCEITGRVGLDRHRFDLRDADLEELLPQLVQRLGAWRVLELIDNVVIEDYIDPDERLRFYDDYVGGLENQIADAIATIQILSKKLKEQA